ncbi:MAG TPA: DUF420 domain-containing protein [Bacteroidota bacterium]
MTFSDLPLLNALLNTATTALLLTGFYFIRKKQVSRHRRFMISALVVSVGFLTSYLVYHFEVGSVRFTGEGISRSIYFIILISHTILAAAVPFLAGITLSRALTKKFDKHRRIARWTLPIWLYVSVTGVVIYLMLYQFYAT